jgi:NADH dehydrogenase
MAIKPGKEYIRNCQGEVNMKIIIAGCSGFVGLSIARYLLDLGHEVIPLIRPGSESKIDFIDKVDPLLLDPLEPMEPVTGKVDVLINAIGIIREFPSRGITFEKIHYEIARNLVDFAKMSGIPRFIQISALGVSSGSETGYQRSKARAEEYIFESGLNWTIFRPSMIIGPGDHVTDLFSDMVRRLPIVPVIGDGNYKLQPVHIDDLCEGLAKSLEDTRAAWKIFELGGPEVLTFNHMLDQIGKALGKPKVRKMRQPVTMMRFMAGLFGRFKWFPITAEQITMLLSDNYTDDRSFFDLYSLEPRRFKDSLAELLTKNKLS